MSTQDAYEAAREAAVERRAAAICPIDRLCNGSMVRGSCPRARDFPWSPGRQGEREMSDLVTELERRIEQQGKIAQRAAASHATSVYTEAHAKQAAYRDVLALVCADRPEVSP